MVWILNQQILRGRKTRIWGGAFLCWLFLMLATPKVPLSPHGNLFADMRNFLGMPFFFFVSHVVSLVHLWDRPFVVDVILLSGYMTGVPNTLNVITNFPFLIVGVIGFVLTLQGSFFKIRLILLDFDSCVSVVLS